MHVNLLHPELHVPQRVAVELKLSLLHPPGVLPDLALDQLHQVRQRVGRHVPIALLKVVQVVVEDGDQHANIARFLPSGLDRRLYLACSQGFG